MDLRVKVGAVSFGKQALRASSGFLPCLTKTWLTSSNISQPSTIMRSMARFFLMFSVSLTCKIFELKAEKI